MRIIDATDMVLGRLSTHVAKSLLNGDEIALVNAEKAIVLGSRDTILREYREKRRIGSARKGPHYPKMPDRILKRTVRGMLDYQKPRGRAAYRRLKTYIGIPKEFTDKPIERLEQRKVMRRYLTLVEISKALGAKL